jgi:hypothetical protein
MARQAPFTRETETMDMVTIPCASCGTNIGRMLGDSALASEFCGTCNAAYFESLVPRSDSVTLAQLEALSYRTHVSHAAGNAGVSDEECCGACYAYRRWLSRERDTLTGELPQETKDIHARTLRVFFANVDAGRETVTDTRTMDEERRYLARCN